MKAEILSIGTELLVGAIVNTNARFLSRRLAESAVDVYRQVSVGDNVGRIVEAFAQALRRADVVISSGGLGPTEDDVTMQALAELLGRPLSPHAPTLRHVTARLKNRGYTMNRLTARQCRVPRGVTRVYQNPVGTAPAVLHELAYAGNRKWVLVFPGPPRELEPMFERALPELLKRARMPRGHFLIRTVHIAGLTETRVASGVSALLKSKPPLTVGIYARPGDVDLKIMCKSADLSVARRRVAAAERVIRSRFGAHVYGVDDETLESAVGALLKRRRATLSLAESCTGGLATNYVSDVPGSSAYLKGSVVAYSNRVKSSLLGVPQDVLDENGAVSPQTAFLMASGVRRLFGTDYGVGITGIAGPSGGTAKKPVGLVYIAVAGPGGTAVSENRFHGTRGEIKSRAARKSLDLLRRALIRKRS